MVNTFKVVLGSHGDQPGTLRCTGAIMLTLAAGVSQTVDLSNAQSQGQSIECALSMVVAVGKTALGSPVSFDFTSGQNISILSGSGTKQGFAMLDILQPNPIRVTVTCAENVTLFINLFNRIAKQLFWKN